MKAKIKFPKLFPLVTIVGSLLIIGALFLPVIKVEWDQKAAYDKFDEWSEQNQCEEMEDYGVLLNYTCAEDYDEDRTDDKNYVYETAYNSYISTADIPADNGISILCGLQMIPGVACSVLAILLSCLLYWKKKLNRKYFYGIVVLSIAGLALYCVDTNNYIADTIDSQTLTINCLKASPDISAWVFAAGNVLLCAAALGNVLRKK